MFIEEVASVMGLERQTGFMRKYEKSLMGSEKYKAKEAEWGRWLGPRPFTKP